MSDRTGGGTIGATRAESCVPVIDLSRRSSPVEGGFGIPRPVLDGGACPWTLEHHTVAGVWELGSVNPVVIGPGRDATAGEELAAGLAASFTLGQGQFCTKPRLVFVPEASRIPDLVAMQFAAVGGRMLTTSISAALDRDTEAIGTIARVHTVVRGRAADADTDGRVPRTAPTVFHTDLNTVLEHRDVLLEECFGPTTLLVTSGDVDELQAAVATLPGALTATVHAVEADLDLHGGVIDEMRDKVGRVLFGGWPTGVAVVWSMQHGGPWPATTNPLFTSVGATAARRFLRPITYQDAPESLLPPAVRSDNPWHVPTLRGSRSHRCRWGT